MLLEYITLKTSQRYNRSIKYFKVIQWRSQEFTLGGTPGVWGFDPPEGEGPGALPQKKVV